MNEVYCFVCKRAGPTNKYSREAYSREAINWDWFTGYLAETVYFCPIHKDSIDRAIMFVRSQEKPKLEAQVSKDKP
jgi:hypothetical protein